MVVNLVRITGPCFGSDRGCCLVFLLIGAATLCAAVGFGIFVALSGTFFLGKAKTLQTNDINNVVQVLCGHCLIVLLDTDTLKVVQPTRSNRVHKIVLHLVLKQTVKPGWPAAANVKSQCVVIACSLYVKLRAAFLYPFFQPAFQVADALSVIDVQFWSFGVACPKLVKGWRSAVMLCYRYRDTLGDTHHALPRYSNLYFHATNLISLPTSNVIKSQSTIAPPHSYLCGVGLSRAACRAIMARSLPIYSL